MFFRCWIKKIVEKIATQVLFSHEIFWFYEANFYFIQLSFHAMFLFFIKWNLCILRHLTTYFSICFCSFEIDDIGVTVCAFQHEFNVLRIYSKHDMLILLFWCIHSKCVNCIIDWVGSFVCVSITTVILSTFTLI